MTEKEKNFLKIFRKSPPPGDYTEKEGGMHMGKFDPSVEQKVWQRVNAQGGQQGRDDLRPLIMSAREAAADYRFLRDQLKGPAGEQAKKLWEGAQETLSCLHGLQLLRGGAVRKQQPLPQSQQPLRRVLEVSYHRCRRMAAEYTARSAETECGMVFVRLAQREQEHCVRLAWILGQMGK